MEESKRSLHINEGFRTLVKLVITLVLACIALTWIGLSRDLARMLLTTSIMLYCIVYLAAKAACLDGHMAYLEEAMRRSKLIAGRIEQGFICPFYGEGHDPQAIACANCPAREKCKSTADENTKKGTN